MTKRNERWSKTGKQINSQQGVKEDNETTGREADNNKSWMDKEERGRRETRNDINSRPGLIDSLDS
jgi:hypothetical protein